MSDDQRPKTRRFPWDVSDRWAARCAEAGYPETLGHLAYVLCLLASLALLWLVLDLGIGLISAARSAPLSDSEQFRNVAVFFVALLSAPFVVWRAVTADRAASAARQQAKTAETTNITSRINEAVKMLGTEKTLNEVVIDPHSNQPSHTVERIVPNLEVRLGALYALERIAQDSLRDHVPIMETLCAYIRENSENLEELARPRIDILTAFTILGRRGLDQRAQEAMRTPRYNPDLGGAKLERNDLRGLDLRGISFARSKMESVALDLARIERANFVMAEMSGASFSEANMKGAILIGAKLDGADFTLAEIDGAGFGEASMRGAYLNWITLSEIDFERVSVDGAGLQSGDYSEVLKITPSKAMKIFADGSILLPEFGDFVRPPHWCAERLKIADFISRWRNWRERNGLAWPPAGHALARLGDHPATPFDSPVQPHEIDPDWTPSTQ